MKNLEELCLSQNIIEKIEGLEHNLSLRKLFLTNNNLKKIEGLDRLKNLEALWLSENEIRSLKGLENLIELKELWMAGNKITYIGKHLSSLTKLTYLNLANNHIGNLLEVINLQSLTRLRALHFSDPHFGDNPLCNLCNYQVYVVYHLTQLTQLDSCTITEEFKNTAETTFLKKRMYYDMRVKTTYRSADNIKNIVSKSFQSLENNLNGIFIGTIKGLKAIERELDEAELRPLCLSVPDPYSYDGQPSNHLYQQGFSELKPLLIAKQNTLRTKLQQKSKVLSDIAGIVDMLKEKIQLASIRNIQRLLIEYNTGGNIRYEEGTPEDNWYSSCVDLIQARVNSSPTDDFSIGITRVIRIYNRFLRNRFEEKLESLVDVTDAQYKRSIEYLFYSSDVAGDEEFQRVMEDGFRTCEEYSDRGYPSCIPLVNSVATAEAQKLRRLKEGKNKYLEFMPTGQLLICKVFLGKFQPDTLAPYYEVGQTASQVWKNRPLTKPTDYWAVYRSRDDDSKQRIWFVFDNHLVLPEYLIEFEYKSNSTPSEMPTSGLEYEDMERGNLTSLQLSLYVFKQLCQIKTMLIKPSSDTSQPSIPERKLTYTYTPELILPIAQKNDLSEVVYLNLHDVKLKELNLPYLANLEVLKISFNSIKQILFIHNTPSLKELDISYNRVNSLKMIHTLSKLSILDASYNIISDLHDIQDLKNCSYITTVNLQGNDVSFMEYYRYRVLLALPWLNEIDTELVTKDERKEIQKAPKEVNLELVHKKLYDSVDVTMLKDAYWYSNIEELKLGDINLLSLDGLSVFMNLKILSLANNHIKEIKNLDNLRKLEMLNLHNNLISEISGLENLVMLQKIDLGKNFIKQIKNLHTLSCLTHLSLEHNRISSFGSIESVKSLMELYLYNNFLTQIKDIQILKSLTKLIILDISGNSMVQSTDYRLFVVYHLKKLKVLDGLPIDPNEQNSAREMYGGRLTEEILDKRLNGMHCNEIPILDLSEAKLKSFDNFVNAEIFCKLSELNLSGNHISSFNFISEMPRLTKLHLSRNRIDTLIAPKDRGLAVLNSLDTLDLSHNLLKDLNGLQMCALPTLRVLVLTGNQISKLEFVSHLSHLKELVLTGNKLRQVEPTSFTPSCGLRFLIIDDNGLRTLANIGRLVKLQCLQAANNRISDFSELDRLTDLPNLMELNLSGNSISRKNMYRLAVIKRITQLVFLDSQEVTPEERERVDGAPEQTPPLLVHINQPPLPKVPVKITSVNFDGLVMKAQEQIGRRPSSSNNLNGVLGVTPLSFTMKPKKPKK